MRLSFHRRALFVPIIAGAIGCSGAANAAESYAAFAVIPGHGATDHGYGRGETASAARAAALATCKSRRCEVVQEYRPGQCAHVVLGTFQVFWNDTEFTKAHGAEVVAYCQQFDEGCRVLVNECF